MKIVVVGGGKMGLPLACMFAHHGALVTVCDRDAVLVEQINEGCDPHNEPELNSYLRAGISAGRLRATTATTPAVADAEAIVVLVSAHLSANRDIDWTNLVAATEAIAEGLQRGSLVTYETTLPVGGCRGTLVPLLERSGLKAGVDFDVVFSPERVKSRYVFARLENTPKVVGGFDARSAAAGARLYARWLGAPVIDVGSLEAAEFVKLAGMVYRDVNIALANELAGFAEDFGLDVWPLIRAANSDDETALLLPGIGVGGHCTPVYPNFLINGAMRIGSRTELVSLARHINDDQPGRQITRLSRALGGLAGRRVHILGLAFRPQVPEDAYSPAFALRDGLAASGAIPTVEDPFYDAGQLRARGFTPRRVGVDKLDAVVLNTAHSEFANPNFSAWRTTGIEVVLDGRAFWDRTAVESAGIRFLGIGIAESTSQ